MAQVKAGKIRLAFCWAHVRRDFLAVLVSWDQFTDWALQWVAEIAELYHRNNARREARQQNNADAFAVEDHRVREQVAHIAARRDAELQQPDLHPACRRPLNSLVRHWTGLTIFVDHPEVPMDNNQGERSERGPVVGRKNFYGSAALWSGRLAAMLFSVVQTLLVWGLCPQKWLTAYLKACAAVGGQVPADPTTFLPWNLSLAQQQELAAPVRPEPSDTS